MKRNVHVATAFAFVAAVGSACSGTFEDVTPVCLPGKLVACFCATGAPGERACTADGLDYEACECLPDAGVDGAADAAPDSAQVDAPLGPDAGPP